MKFEVKSHLLKASGICKPSDAPVAIRAVKEPPHVVLMTYDGVKFVQCSMDANVHEGGEVVFPAQYLGLLNVVEGVVSVRCSGSMEIKDGVRSFRVTLQPSHEGVCMSMPAVEQLGSLTVELPKLQTLIKRVRFATGTAESQGFDRVLLGFGEEIRAVGCDRRSIAVARLLQGSPYKGEFLLPKEGLDVLGRLSGDLCTLTIYRSGVAVTVDGEVMFDIYVPEHSCKFPNVDESLDHAVNTTMKCDRDELYSVLRDTRAVSDKVNINLGYHGYVKQFPKFTSRDDNNAQAKRTLKKAEWDGEELRLQVNARVLMQAIEHLEGEVELRFLGHNGPYSVCSGDEFVALLLPYAAGERK